MPFREFVALERRVFSRVVSPCASCLSRDVVFFFLHAWPLSWHWEEGRTYSSPVIIFCCYQNHLYCQCSCEIKGVFTVLNSSSVFYWLTVGRIDKKETKSRFLYYLLSDILCIVSYSCLVLSLGISISITTKNNKVFCSACASADALISWWGQHKKNKRVRYALMLMIF